MRNTSAPSHLEHSCPACGLTFVGDSRRIWCWTTAASAVSDSDAPSPTRPRSSSLAVSPRRPSSTTARSARLATSVSSAAMIAGFSASDWGLAANAPTARSRWPSSTSGRLGPGCGGERSGLRTHHPGWEGRHGTASSGRERGLGKVPARRQAPDAGHHRTISPWACPPALDNPSGCPHLPQPRRRNMLREGGGRLRLPLTLTTEDRPGVAAPAAAGLVRISCPLSAGIVVRFRRNAQRASAAAARSESTTSGSSTPECDRDNASPSRGICTTLLGESGDELLIGDSRKTA